MPCATICLGLSLLEDVVSMLVKVSLLLVEVSRTCVRRGICMSKTAEYATGRWSSVVFVRLLFFVGFVCYS